MKKRIRKFFINLLDLNSVYCNKDDIKQLINEQKRFTCIMEEVESTLSLAKKYLATKEKKVDKVRCILSDQRDRIDYLSKEVQRLKTNKNKNNGRRKDADTRSGKEAS